MVQRKINGMILPPDADWREGVYSYQRHGQLSPVAGRLASQFARGSKLHLANPDVPAERRVIDHVIDACEFRGVSNIPPIAIADTKMVNAASVAGKLIVFTSGIMKTMPDHELRAVAGHEISHYRHAPRDFTIMGTTAALTHGILHHFNLHTTQPYESAMRSAGWSGKIASYFVAPLVYAAIVTTAMTPWRWHMERESDREGADFMGAKTMGDALESLHRSHVKHPAPKQQEPKSVGRTCVDAVKKLLKFVLFPFSSHPPIESRIAEMRERHQREQAYSFEMPIPLLQPNGYGSPSPHIHSNPTELERLNAPTADIALSHH